MTVLDGPLIHAAAIDIRWQKLQVASSTSAPSITAPSTESTTVIPTAPVSESPISSSISTGEASQQLAVDAIVGIGVGVGVGALLLAVIGYLVYRLRNIKSSRGAGGEQLDRPGLSTTRQYYGVPPGSQQPHNHSAVSPFELPSDEQKQEMITNYNRHEAEAAYVHEVHNNPRPSELPSSPYLIR